MATTKTPASLTESSNTNANTNIEYVTKTTFVILGVFLAELVKIIISEKMSQKQQKQMLVFI